MSNRSVIAISAHPGIGKLSEADYFRLYEESLSDPDRLWGEAGKRLDWIRPYTRVGAASFTGDVSIRWYEDGTLNASYNCIDRHLPLRADETAILWEGDDPGEDRRVTYRQLHDSVGRLANVLKAHGVKKGDRVKVIAGRSKGKVGDVLRRSEIEKANGDLGAKKQAAEYEAHCEYLSAWEEDKYIVAQANVAIDDNGRIVDDLVNARQAVDEHGEGEACVALPPHAEIGDGRRGGMPGVDEQVQHDLL